ncbi:MAG TPA: ATP-binding cassette domain-containing protein [Actinospica sp.]|jgi:ABC-2 type transport system ATP-binding protein|nr:ATP-binding cassette domain-containing protein [Actinospica sp.]
MADAMIDVQAVTKTFAATRALDGVTLQAPRGSVLTLLGPNGAGKTTLVRILATLLHPDSGTARVAGLDVVRDARALRPLIGLAGQYAAVDELLTGRENLELVGSWYHLPRAEYRHAARDLLERFALTDVGDRLVKTYSGGMRRRLDIAASLVARPPVLFLDEPTSGLDPRTRNDLWTFLKDLVADGTTLVLTTQYMEEAEHLAHRIAVLAAGRVIAQGTALELKRAMGGDVLEARVHDPADLDTAAGILGRTARREARLDLDQRRVTVPAHGGTGQLIAAGRALQDAGIALEDLGIRRPSLDEVFLALTGTPADARSAEPSPLEHTP